MDKILPYLPNEGLFHLYHEYTDVTEVCPRFRFFAMTAAIGSLLRRKVHFQRSTYALFPTLYPNPWVILVAPQGRGHKSTALRTARMFLQKLSIEHQPHMLASKLTPEKLASSLASQAITDQMTQGVDPNLIKVLKRKAQGLIHSSELGVFLGKEKYNQGMIALLTDLYDCPDEWTSGTIMRGDQMLYEVCLSIMAASTPDWMQTMLPSDTFRGGFMSRLILVAYPEVWHKRIADPPLPDERLAEEIVTILKEIALLRGEAHWTSAAKDFFEDWYLNVPEELPGPRAAYRERKQDHILKIAIILQVAKNRKLTMELETLEQSLAILNAVEPETLTIIDYISTEPRMRVVQRVCELIKASPQGMTEARLLARVWKDLGRPGEFNEVMQLLVKSETITIGTIGSKVAYFWGGKN